MEMMNRPEDRLNPESDREVLQRELLRAKKRQLLMTDILELLGKESIGSSAVRQLIEMMTEFTGCEAAGIRLRQDVDFPYSDTKGFPSRFVETESFLCKRTPLGEIVRDSKGNPVLECLCGAVLSGHINPANSSFTKKGSFWSNNMTRMSEVEPAFRPAAVMRGQCPKEGYKSVALIPLRSGNQTIGLLQLADSRENRFTLDMIEFFERIGMSIGIVLARVQIEEALRKANDQLEKDIAKRKRAESIMLARLRLVKYAASHSLEQLLQAVLDEAEALTESEIGFYHFVETDQKNLSFQAWSTRTLQDGMERHYTLDNLGVWRDCVHQRKPVVHNDYSVLPHRNGPVTGHMRIIRELVVPVFRDDRIVAILGVGNKSTDYNTDDIETVSLLADLAWDISERKRSEDALRAAASYNRSLIEASPDPLITVSPEGKIMDVNTAMETVTGYSKLELIGTDVTTYFTDPEKTLNGYQQVFRDGGLRDFAQELYRKDGRIISLLYNASVYRDDQGKIIGMVAAARDITERKLAEEELKRTLSELTGANADLEQFAYVASHDLQEPLRNVASCIQLLQKEYKQQLVGDAEQYMHYAMESIERMRELIHSLLLHSRIETKGKTLKPADCNQILLKALKNLKVAVTETDTLVTSDPLPTICADNFQLLQVFQNLIGNALKFQGSKRPKIHVSAAKHGDEWIFSVKDNGIGIEKRNLDKIFVIFQQLHKRSEYGGTGIGLAIVKKVVERHGGRVWVESEPGVGSTFYFTMSGKGRQL